MKHSVVTITPTMAQLMLESNANNRKLDDRIVAQYARDMSNDAWKINGETIKFSSTGKLLDGQHRLHGCVRSGKDLVTMMVEGLADDSFTTIDVGKKRSTAQILAISGYVNTTVLAAAVRYINMIERGIFRPSIGGSMGTMPAAQVKEWVEAHPFIVDAVNEGGRIHRFCSKAGAAACYFLMHKSDPVLCHQYFLQIFSGENLKRGDPAFAVRNRLINFDSDKQKKSYEQAAILIRGWNALRKGEEMLEVKAFAKNKSGEYNAVEIE